MSLGPLTCSNKIKKECGVVCVRAGGAGWAGWAIALSDLAVDAIYNYYNNIKVILRNSF